MIGGRQIRAARHMLAWSFEYLNSRSGVSANLIEQAELSEGARGITPFQAGLIQQAFEKAGVRFGENGAVLMPLRKQDLE